MDDNIAFEYRTIESITNKYFLDYQSKKGLFSVANLCTEIDSALKEKKYVDCMIKLRMVNESLIIFLHEFFVNERRDFSKEYGRGAKDRIDGLTEYFNEDETALGLILKFTLMQNMGNAYHHPEKCTAKQVKACAEQCIPIFSDLLSSFVKFLELNVPNIDTNNVNKKRITGEVSLHWVKEKHCITATVTGSNCEEGFFYKWLIGDKQSRFREKDTVIKGPNRNTFQLEKDAYVGKYVTCLVSCAVPDLYSGHIKNHDFFRLTKEMFEPVKKKPKQRSISPQINEDQMNDNGHGQEFSEETIVEQRDRQIVQSRNTANSNSVARREESTEISLQKKLKNFFLSLSEKKKQVEEKEAPVVEEIAKKNEIKTGTLIEDDPTALYCLGRKYLFGGRRIEKDYAKAKELFQKAAALGNAEAINSLGALYYEGRGVDQDYSKAKELYQKAADLGSARAICNLGLLYESGYSVDQDYSKAKELYQKAADLGVAEAMINLGALYINGCGVDEDYAKAKELFQKAAALGNADAMINLGLLYSNGCGVDQDYSKAKELYQKAADLGDAEAVYLLEDLYQEGCGVDQDYSKAEELRHKAVELGDVNAMLKLGVLYEDGEGVEQDYQKAAEWYQKAADLGNKNAMIILGVLYRYGKGIEKDYQKAAEWYQKAADLGDDFAMNELGSLYKYGEGVEQDYQKAAEWYQKATNLGNARAMCNLGLLYEYGEGMEKDYGKAKELFQKAADLGDDFAMNELKALKEIGNDVEISPLSIDLLRMTYR